MLLLFFLLTHLGLDILDLLLNFLHAALNRGGEIHRASDNGPLNRGIGEQEGESRTNEKAFQVAGIREINPSRSVAVLGIIIVSAVTSPITVLVIVLVISGSVGLRLRGSRVILLKLWLCLMI